MIGVYDYTMWLTYLSLLSAGTGIVVSLSGNGHPYIGSLFLLICGLCDAFDGRVARSKKDRSEFAKKFGVQIDSLSDLVAFGVLPACLGAALFRTSPFLTKALETYGQQWYSVLAKGFLFAILIFYILAAMIRLAYFNVTEEERQKTEGGCRKVYTGLPVTASALIFPSMLCLRYMFAADVTLVYFVAAVFTGIAFLLKIEVPKPGLRGILAMVGIGTLEFIVVAIFWWIRNVA